MQTQELGTKRQLLKECKKVLNVQVKAARDAMEYAQQSAKETLGAVEDESECIRESCQAQRDMYARQLEEMLTTLALLRRINVTKVNLAVSPGAVVRTELHNYFIGASVCEIKVEGESYYAVSSMSPLYKAMAGKTTGDSFALRGREYKKLQVY